MCNIKCLQLGFPSTYCGILNWKTFQHYRTKNANHSFFQIKNIGKNWKPYAKVLPSIGHLSYQFGRYDLVTNISMMISFYCRRRGTPQWSWSHSYRSRFNSLIFFKTNISNLFYITTCVVVQR